VGVRHARSLVGGTFVPGVASAASPARGTIRKVCCRGDGAGVGGVGCSDRPGVCVDGRSRLGLRLVGVAQVAVGTFNSNNLFSRFDFTADVSTADASSVKVEERTSFEFEDPAGFKLRTISGGSCVESRRRSGR
jgi:hypothetical protein